MKVMATINHTIDKDTASIVKEFGHKAILENLEPKEIKKSNNSGKIGKGHL